MCQTGSIFLPKLFFRISNSMNCNTEPPASQTPKQKKIILNSSYIKLITMNLPFNCLTGALDSNILNSSFLSNLLLSKYLVTQLEISDSCQSSPFSLHPVSDQGRFMQYILVSLPFHLVYSIPVSATLSVLFYICPYYFPSTPDEELLRQRVISFFWKMLNE